MTHYMWIDAEVDNLGRILIHRSGARFGSMIIVKPDDAVTALTSYGSRFVRFGELDRKHVIAIRCDEAPEFDGNTLRGTGRVVAIAAESGQRVVLRNFVMYSAIFLSGMATIMVGGWLIWLLLGLPWLALHMSGDFFGRESYKSDNWLSWWGNALAHNYSGIHGHFALPKERIPLVQRNYPDVQLLPAQKFVRRFPHVRPQTVAPAPDTDPDFWTRAA